MLSTVIKRARWRNGLARLQQLNPDANICAMWPNYLARGYQGLHVKQANKQTSTCPAGLINIGWSNI